MVMKMNIFCQKLNLPYWKVLRLNKKYSEKEIKNTSIQFEKSQVFLLDKYNQKVYGGTGSQMGFDKNPVMAEC